MASFLPRPASTVTGVDAGWRAISFDKRYIYAVLKAPQLACPFHLDLGHVGPTFRLGIPSGQQPA